jgi:MFS family permease
MKDLVTEDRGNYFGKRNRIAGFISFICTIVGGFLLDYFKGTKLFMGFIILFSLAFIGRAISAYLMRKQYEPKFEYDDKYYFSFKLFLKRMNQNNFGRFSIYTTLISFAVNISAPFLTVYMIKDLSFSYVNYMVVILSPVVTTILFMPLWGKFADKYGNVKTMRMSGYLTALMPLLWFLSAFIIPKQYVFLYLVFVEAFSGIVWAGFNLASANFVYDAVSRQRMAICNTYDSITTTFGVMIGALIGGFLSSMKFNFLGINAILAVFLLGALLRLIVQISWSSKFNEVRVVQPFILEDYINELGGKLKDNLSLKKFLSNIDVSAPQ